LYWTEKADDYSAQCQVAASDNGKKRTTGRAIPAESGIIRYFSPDRYLPAPLALPRNSLIQCIYKKMMLLLRA
jgi:hypothetical protein